ncbi:cytochrome P450 [Nocardioides sp. T2.26MG-1]|uniref:cytochrome P450 n=1 Tax=Nocardioides sp. T2.26MG-1 TaxID=3041166 RepID=UPI002477C7B6|nr:cytochrome P450 [Nocardioides sp. T2.26MG-1]CAI9404684.1 Cytochrome P450-terp [Nocardioides sp. T2.26MG-1]
MGEPVEIDTGQVADQRTVYDAQRGRCPVAHEDGAWVVLRHAEVVAAATDPATYSSDVSSRRAIPNSLDGAEHAAYRAVVDRYLTPGRVAREEPQCRAHAAAIVDALPRDTTVKTVGGIGVPYAVRSQSTWLGWRPDLEDDLVAWMQDNHAATRSGDRARTAEVAERFDRMVHTLLDARRDAPAADVTGELLGETVDGRPLTDEEVVSILRNWTAGDLGSLATSVGVIVHFLATNPAVQRVVRAQVEAGDRAAVEAAVEEILRIDDPFVANRRVATREAELGGETIPEGGRVLLNWTAANRDPLVFGDPDEYDPAGHAAANLVFGIGPHVCPGRDLTLMELRVVVEELLARTSWIEPAPDRPAVRETPPVGGWARVPVVLR